MLFMAEHFCEVFFKQCTCQSTLQLRLLSPLLVQCKHANVVEYNEFLNTYSIVNLERYKSISFWYE